MAGWLHETGLRIKALFRKSRLRREMAEELAFHRAMLREKLAHEGAEPEHLEASVRQTFGDERRWQERLAELWQFRWLENLLRDLSFAARILRKSPGFTVVALLTLILGIGANAAVFSLVNGLLLRPLPVPHAEELAVLHLPGRSFGYSLSTPIFRLLEKRTDLFQNVFAFAHHDFQVRNGTRNESFPGALVSGQFFSGLGVQPQLGRYLNPSDDRPGGASSGLAVVISDQFWKRWFNRAPDVIGRTLLLDNVSFTVVGVMPKTFIGADPTSRPQIYAALAVEPLVDAPRNMAASYRSWWSQIAIRRKAGMSLAQANAALRAISAPIMQEAIPDPKFRINSKTREQLYLAAEPASAGFSYLQQQFRYPLIVIFVLCGAVLLLACLNLASLLLARAAAREREIATRLAIGATRRRVIQQLLVESMLLAGSGSLIGLAVAPFAAHALSVLMLTDHVPLDTGIDARVLLFAAGLSLLCTLIIGMVPALQASSGSLQEHGRQGGNTLRAARRHRILSRILLAGEVALALTVVTGAGLLGTSLVRLYRTGLGFDPHGVLLVDLDLSKMRLKDNSLLQFYRSFAEEAAHIPNVSSISYASVTPLSGDTSWDDSWNVNGKKGTVYLSNISPGYFRTMSIPMRQGRDFAWSDTDAAPLRVVLNQAAADYFFPKVNPVGQQIRISNDKTAKAYEVIGVVGNTKYQGVRDEAPPMAYEAMMQGHADNPFYSAVLRMQGKPGPVADALHNIINRLAPAIPAPTILTMEEQLQESISSERMIAMLAVFFGICALLVTGIGLYGTLAYSTARRTSEIGIRMALGAQRGEVAWMVFRENAMVAVIGSLAGLGVALLASRALAALLYDTSTHDVPVLLLSVVALGMMACVASLLPALRASRIEPMEAIRCE